MKKVIIIPARLESTRLPNKLLLDLGGKSIIQRVYDQCRLVKNVDTVLIAVDDQKLLNHCNIFTKNVVLTSKNHQSGTDRIAEAAALIDCDVIINVQGDEPFIDPKLIETIAERFEDKTTTMVSAMCKMEFANEIKDPNNVKVITDINSNAIYFSRLPIPYNRDVTLEDSSYYKHLGIYGYTTAFLNTFSKMDPTYLEQTEKLEQLRVLENGYTISMIETTHNVIGIDTLEDYNKAKELVHLL